MKIFVHPKRHYNKIHYYPDCTASELFAKLAGTKTLTIQALKIIKALGYDVCVKQAVSLPAEITDPKYYH
jgi:hypothetical protein